MSNLMDHEKGKNLLLLTAEVLNSLRIPFFLIQGTALGAYRDKGFTPTERDIDIGFLQEDMSGYVVRSLISILINKDLDIEVFVKPFSYVRTLVVWGEGAKLDLVGFSKHKNQRYTASPIRPWTEENPYAIVHDSDIIEFHDDVEMFGRTWKVPSPIETYLQREYGDWKTAREDHVSQTRIYNYLKTENIL
jgi:phosphorylcholine metabolism protein LicD